MPVEGPGVEPRFRREMWELIMAKAVAPRDAEGRRGTARDAAGRHVRSRLSTEMAMEYPAITLHDFKPIVARGVQQVRR
jgi:hypothetical protein